MEETPADQAPTIAILYARVRLLPAPILKLELLHPGEENARPRLLAAKKSMLVAPKQNINASLLTLHFVETLLLIGVIWSSVLIQLHLFQPKDALRRTQQAPKPTLADLQTSARQKQALMSSTAPSQPKHAQR